MNKNAYAEKLRDPRWQKKRVEVLSRDQWKCSLCGDKETEFHVHHRCYTSSGNPWDSSIDDLTTLCKDCHFIIEVFKKAGYEIIRVLKRDKIYAFGYEDSTKAVIAVWLYERNKNSKPSFIVALSKEWLLDVQNEMTKLLTTEENKAQSL